MVEILVALTLFGILSAAMVPLLVTTLRASMIAKLDTAAKNLSQKRFEDMRNMPFRIAYDPAVTTSVDMLDIYYPNLTAAGGVTSAGYVTSQARNTGEPTGAFYRKVFTETLGGTDYKISVATQFLSPDTKAALAPASTYDTQTLNDYAPSTLVGVTVIATWQAGALSKRFAVYSEISDVPPAVALLTLRGRASALKVSTSYGSGETGLVLEAGVVSLDAETTSGSTASSSAQGAYASLTPGGRVNGASKGASAPPDAAASSATDASSYSLTNSGNTLAVIPRTAVDNVAAKTSGSVPVVGSSAAPVTATAYGSADLRFSNGPNLGDSALGLNGADPVAWISANGSTIQARATGYATSVSGTAHSGTASVSAQTDVIKVLRTSWASDGLVQLQLTSSSLQCGASTATPTSTPAYVAQYRLLQYAPSDPANPLGGGTIGYTAWQPLASTQLTDPLAAVSLTVGTGGWPVGLQSGRVVYLGEYVSGLTSQTATTLAKGAQNASDGKGVDVAQSAMVSLTTKPLRTGESYSAVKVELGSLGCTAEDRR